MTQRRIVQIANDPAKPGYQGTLYGLDDEGALWQLYHTSNLTSAMEAAGVGARWILHALPIPERTVQP